MLGRSQQRGEACARVEARSAQPIDGAVTRHQRRGARVAEQAVVFDRGGHAREVGPRRAQPKCGFRAKRGPLRDYHRAPARQSERGPPVRAGSAGRVGQLDVQLPQQRVRACELPRGPEHREVGTQQRDGDAVLSNQRA